MEVSNINPYSQYYKNTNSSSKTNEENTDSNTTTDYSSKIHNSAVNVSISMESIKVFLNIKSMEMNRDNTNAQNSLMNIINNIEVYDFLSGKENEDGFSLKSIGYEGKAITELSPEEAKELVSDDGFFGITQTSDRVSSFVLSIANNDLEALQEARKGIVQGFEEAEKMWGGELPEISYATQERTLSIIDEKIAELTKTDLEKEVEDTNS